MWVKICANTFVEDALKAAELGVDAIGFVFAPSKRQVHAAQVRAITSQMPKGIELIGVFADATAENIAHDIVEGGLTAAQLHGGVDQPKVRQIRSIVGHEIDIIHTVSWHVGDDEGSAASVRAQLRELAPGERVLVDAQVGATSGGLGVSFDWARARGVLLEFPELQVVVAGGLRSENVAEAVRVLKPYGVDVASGVELSAGKKDHAKLQSFIENARRG